MKNKDKFKEIFDKSPIGILIYDDNGKLVDANQSALEISGISKLEDILGINLFDNPVIAEKKNKLLKEGSIKFRQLYLENSLNTDLYESTDSRKVLINYIVSIINYGFLVHIQTRNEYKEDEKFHLEDEDKYRSFFEDDLTGDFIATPEGAIHECNPSFMEIYCFENREKALKSNISKFNPTDWINTIAQLKKERKIKGHQSKHIRQDGTIIHVIANLVGIFNDSDELIEIKGYVFDDTERKNAEKFLKESEEKYRRLFDEDLTGDFIATIDGQIIECNPAFAEIYAFNNIQMASKSNFLKFNQFDWPYMITRLKKERKLQGFQSWQRRSDGMRIHVIANLVGIFNDSDELIRVKGYIFDDTERKKAEEELNRSKSQISEMLDSIQDGFIALTHNWHFIYVNHSAAEYFGVEHDDLIGQNLWEQFPELIGTIYEVAFRKTMETEEIQHFESRSMPNSDHLFDFSVYPLADGISVYFRDVSMRQKKK